MTGSPLKSSAPSSESKISRAASDGANAKAEAGNQKFSVGCAEAFGGVRVSCAKLRAARSELPRPWPQEPWAAPQCEPFAKKFHSGEHGLVILPLHVLRAECRRRHRGPETPAPPRGLSDVRFHRKSRRESLALAYSETGKCEFLMHTAAGPGLRQEDYAWDPVLEISPSGLSVVVFETNGATNIVLALSYKEMEAWRVVEVKITRAGTLFLVCSKNRSFAFGVEYADGLRQGLEHFFGLHLRELAARARPSSLGGLRNPNPARGTLRSPWGSSSVPLLPPPPVHGGYLWRTIAKSLAKQRSGGEGGGSNKGGSGGKGLSIRLGLQKPGNVAQAPREEATDYWANAVRHAGWLKVLVPPEASATWAQARKGIHPGDGSNEDPTNFNNSFDGSFEAFDNQSSAASSSAYGSFAMRGASFSIRGTSIRRMDSSSPSSSASPPSSSLSRSKRRKSTILGLGEAKEGQNESSFFLNSSNSSGGNSSGSSSSSSPSLPPHLSRHAPSAVSSANWAKSGRSESGWIADDGSSSGGAGNGGINCANSVASAEGAHVEKPAASKKAAWRSAFAVLYATPVGHFLALYARATDCPLYSPWRRAVQWLDLSKVTCLRHESIGDATKVASTSGGGAAATGSGGGSHSGSAHGSHFHHFGFSGHAPFAFDICTVDGTEWSLSCALSGSSGKEDRVQWLNLLEASCSDDSGISPDDALPLQCKATIDPSNRLEADDHDAVLLFTAWGVTVQTVMATSSSGLGSGGGADSARNGHGQKHRRQDGHKEAIERMEQQRRVAKGILKARAAGLEHSPDSPKDVLFWPYTDILAWRATKDRRTIIIEVAREGDHSHRQSFVFEAHEPERIATAIEFFLLKCTRRSHNRRLLMDHLDLPYDGESTTTAVADPNQPQSSSQAAGVSSASSKDAAPGDQLPQVVDASDTNAKPTNSGALPQEASTANACPSFNAGDKVLVMRAGTFYGRRAVVLDPAWKPGKATVDMDGAVKSYPTVELILAPPFVAGDHVLVLQDSSPHFGHLATVINYRDEASMGAMLDVHVDGTEVCFSAKEVAIAP